MLARNGIVQGLPTTEHDRKYRIGSSIKASISSQASATTASISHTLSNYSHLHNYGSSRASVMSSSSAEHLLDSVPDDSLPQLRPPSKIAPMHASPMNTGLSLKRPESYRQSLDEKNQKSASAADLTEALSSHDYDKTQWLLERFFRQVAVGEYSWLTELEQLGYSPLEITDELLEKAIHGSWIFEPFEMPVVQPFISDFHQSYCVHNYSESLNESDPKKRKQSKILLTDTDTNGFTLSARQSIEYLCGLGGARPASDGSTEIELGSVAFEENNSKATVTLIGPEDNSVVQEVLENLERAAGALQELGGCCDSFTFLYAHPEYVELHRIPFSVIRQLREQLEQTLGSNRGPSSSMINIISEIMPFIADDLRPVETASRASAYLISLTAQFLALAILSYAQAHCGPIRPFFLDTPLETIILAAHGSPEECLGTNALVAVFGSLVELTCMGDMIGEPVFAFHLLPGFDKSKLPYTGMPPYKLDLFARPEDILDTWGPGDMVASIVDPDVLFSVSVGGGIISAVEPRRPAKLQLHWSRNLMPSKDLPSPFNRKAKVRIGATIIENTNCQANSRAQLKNAVVMLEEMGTFPSYWELAERQLGLGIQGGQAGLAAFQFNQTWIKMAGTTKKSTMLLQHAIYTTDLESLFGVQVSVCTGIARRVRFRDLLADVLPAYVAGLVTKPPLWNSLSDTFNIIPALRQSDLVAWLERLDHAHQTAFENLAFAVLYLLRDTGFDRKGQNFVIACIQPDLPFQCFKVPCKKENYWARMLADSDDTATFAYVTTQCLEAARMKCGGPAASWTNSTTLLWTVVSCYEERIAVAVAVAAPTAAAPDRWALRHSEAYLIGPPDAALFVQVDRPETRAEPRLLVSLSTIPPEYLYRFFRKGRPGKPRRLREKKCFDRCAESVVVLVGKGPKLKGDLVD